MRTIEQEIEKPWQKYMPKHVELYYVSPKDRVDTTTISNCIDTNSFCAIENLVCDNWDNYPLDNYIEDIESEMEANEDGDLMEEYRQEIEDWLYTHDESNVVNDLIDNTDKIPLFFSTGLCIYEPEYSEGSEKPNIEANQQESVSKICQLLQIPEGDNRVELIREIVSESNYGGYLRIYFKARFRDIITNPKEDFQTIKLDGYFQVAVWNAFCGAGFFNRIKLDVELPFNRDKLVYSPDEGKYSMEDACGLCPDWMDHDSKPIFK